MTVKNGRKAGESELTFDERQAAKKIGVSDRTLRRYRKKAEIPFFRIGSVVRYDMGCVEEFLARRRQPAA